MLNAIRKLLSWTIAEERKYTTKRDTPDTRDHRYIPGDDVVKSLPKTVDLRNQDGPLFDQGSLGSCTANGWLGLFMFVFMKMFGKQFIGSRLFLYYNERIIQGTPNEDSGAEVRDGAKSLADDGVCSEDELPYDISTFTEKPSAQCYADAQNYKIVEYQRIEPTLDNLRACLAEGYPFVFGFTVFKSFESLTVARTGIMPMPKKGEKELGGHCVEGIGYIDGDGKAHFKAARHAIAFNLSRTLARVCHGLRILTGIRSLPVTQPPNVIICRNSWGVRWGDKGYFYMPYAFITNPDWASDFWTVRTVTNGKKAA